MFTGTFGVSVCLELSHDLNSEVVDWQMAIPTLSVDRLRRRRHARTQLGPLDVVDLLSVVPEEEEYGISFHYVVQRPNVRLELTLWPMDGDVAMSIYCATQTQPVIRLDLYGCPSARMVKDKRGQFIEFAAANPFFRCFDSQSPAIRVSLAS